MNFEDKSILTHVVALVVILQGFFGMIGSQLFASMTPLPVEIIDIVAFLNIWFPIDPFHSMYSEFGISVARILAALGIFSMLRWGAVLGIVSYGLVAYALFQKQMFSSPGTLVCLFSMLILFFTFNDFK